MDKKSQHVGNHGGAYTDENGMSKQFTYVDHDVKTKISTLVMSKDENMETASEYRTLLIERILNISASLCPQEFYEFTIRGENKDVIEWNDRMLEDAGVEMNRLTSLCNILENRMENIGKTY